MIIIDKQKSKFTEFGGGGLDGKEKYISMLFLSLAKRFKFPK